MNTSILEDLGLTRNEVKVYLALLELGTTTAGPLVKKVGMHRAAVYDLLDLLLDKGIISYILKDNRKNFEAHDPKRLLEYVESKRQELDNKEKKLKKLLPKLNARKQIAQNEQEGTIFTGKRGLKSVFEEVLRVKKEWLVFGAEGKFRELFPSYFTQHHKRRYKLKIPLRIIFNEKLRSKRKVLSHSKIKFLPQSYISPSTTWVYGQNVAIVTWEPNPMAFVIRSKEVAKSYKSFFEVLWKQASK